MFSNVSKGFESAEAEYAVQDDRFAQIGKDGLELTDIEFDDIVRDSISKYFTARQLKQIVEKFKTEQNTLQVLQQLFPKLFSL
ncbi:MAG: hypothetical protein V4485_03500, partial [Pseudomonadota bacterium]